MRTDIVTRDEDTLIDDKGLKNPWKWTWLEASVDGENLAKCIRKLKQPGKAWCQLCNADIKYEHRGRQAITDHMKSKKHLLARKSVVSNYTIPGTGSSSSVCGSVYGLHPMFQKQVQTSTPVAAETFVPIQDRVSNAEATLLGFVAEKSLPFSIVPSLIELTKSLSRDKKALASLSMDRTSASYKMRYGLSRTCDERLSSVLKSTAFSLNIDEATSNNKQRVLCILVSYFSSDLNKVVVEHLRSVSMVTVNSQTVFEAVCDVFSEMKLPWENLVSILMDSCSVMRGSKNGFEIKVKSEKASHLLDIDGDTCHHVHNISKKFCAPFDWWVEQLFLDLHKDHKWSVDLREYLEEICGYLGITFRMPHRFVSHRWLSVYDGALSTLNLLDALTVFYYAFLPKEDKSIYLSVIVEIYVKRKVSAKSRQRPREILTVLGKKSLTSDGKNRKMRICEKILIKPKKTRLILHIYESILPLFKKYVLIMDMKTPMIHKLHDYCLDLARDFLACYVRPEIIIKATSGKKLMNLKDDIADSANVLKEDQIFTGKCAGDIISKECRKNDNTVVSVLKLLMTGYKNSGNYLLQKMPLNNNVLKLFSAVDPICIGHTSALSCFTKLPTVLPKILSECEIDDYQLEIRRINTNSNLPEYDHKTQGIDTWWADVFASGKCPQLQKIICAVLSCFHGPQVESSFNIMGDVINEKSGQMNIDTYSSIQSVKYSMRISGKSAVQYFKKKDFLHEPVDGALCQNMRSAYSTYKHKLEEKREKKKEILNQLECEKHTVISKKTAYKLSVKQVKKAKQIHLASLKRSTPSSSSKSSKSKKQKVDM